MSTWLLPVLAVIIGVAAGFGVTFIFSKLPEKWLQDYDYDPKAPDFRLSKRMKTVPHGIIASFFLAAAYLAAVIFSNEFFFGHGNSNIIRLICVFLVLPVTVMIAMSDRLNRIIPDEFSIAILIIGIFELIADLTGRSYWCSPEAAWYVPVLSRIIAGALGFGVLWLIGFITITFFGKEGMGQGDMKLLGACGFMVGFQGLVIVIYIGILLAALFAIPMFIMKRIRIAKENKMIRESDDPVAKRREIMKAKAQIHFADDPDYLAFGPFLAAGAAVFLVLEPVFCTNLIGIFVAMGAYR